jgi:flagellar hook-associated protein 2
MAVSISSAASTNTSTGLGTGIDVAQFVQLALAGDQANITNLQNSQSALSAQSSALSKITADLTALQTAAFSLNDPLGSLNAQTATSSDSSVLGATAASTAAAGAHTITVTSLATTSSLYTDAAASSSTPVASGGFQLTVGSNTPVSVTVLGSGNYQFQVGTNAPTTVNSTDSTLAGLASAINSQGIGVSASVINDANGARLALVSQTTGAPGDLAITGSLTLNNSQSTVLNFNKAVTGTNAALVVDGVPISSTTNTVTGVINGVTLNLNSPAPATPVTLSVTPDTSKASDALNQFVAAYNTAINDVNAQFAVNADGTGGGPLEADGSLREAQSALLAAVTHSVSGNGGIVNLFSLGVNINNDGTLTVDSAALASSLSSNFSNVQSFLQSASSGFAGNLYSALSNLIDPTAGALGLDAKGIAQSSQDLTQHISDLQAALLTRQQSLTLVYSQVNTTLQELPLLQSQMAQQLASA